jgi:site-specific DNA-methyltransferase (adenine-specific)
LGTAVTPYFSRDGITLYLGDCRIILPELGTGWADCILADPPYGETSLGWDRRVAGWLPIVRATLNRNGSLWCFGSLQHFMAERDAFAAWKLAQSIVWEKHNGSGFAADRFRRVHELVAHFYPDDSSWEQVYKKPVFTRDATKRTVRRKGQRARHTGEIGDSTYVSHDGGPRLMRSVIHVRSCHHKAQHPTEKPCGILSPLIEFSCPPGGTVAVPFAGVGSELEASRLAGRKAIGVELSEKYAERAAKRLEQGILSFDG